MNHDNKDYVDVERIARERKFHNTKAAKSLSLHGYEKMTRIGRGTNYGIACENKKSDFIDLPGSWIARKFNFKEKNVLEIGAGYGIDSEMLEELGVRKLVTVELSQSSLDIAKRRLKSFDNIYFIGSAFEEVDYQGLAQIEKFDIIYARGVLHHLILEKSLPAIYSLLDEAGGVGIFIEPSAENPLINVYRTSTPEQRTADEKPLTIKEIENFSGYGFDVEHYPFFFLSIGSVFLLRKFPFLVQSTICRPLAYSLFKLTALADVFLLKLPVCRRLAWVRVIILRKKSV